MHFFSKNESRYYLQGLCQTNLPVEATISNEQSLTCLSDTTNQSVEKSHFSILTDTNPQSHTIFETVSKNLKCFLLNNMKQKLNKKFKNLVQISKSKTK